MFKSFSRIRLLGSITSGGGGGGGVTSVNGDVGPAVTLDTDDIGEGSSNLYNRSPTGGTAGQVVTKISGTNFDSAYADAPVNHTPVQEEGSQVVANPDALNFISANLTAVDNSNVADITLTDDPVFDSVGIGGATDSTAILDVQSTTRTVVLPRMTNAQKEAIVSPLDGAMVYDTTQEAFNHRIEGVWDRRRILTGQSTILPVHPGIEPDDVAVSSDATLKGGLYQTFQTIVFNRLYVDVQAYGAGRTIRMLMYQDQDGDGVAERICTIETFDPGAIGIQIATPTEDPVILLPGINIIFLWGEDGSGDIKLFSFKNKEISLFNSSTQLATGQIPTTFTTTISSTTSPATVDPTVGGTDGFVGSDDVDSMPVFRLNLV